MKYDLLKKRYVRNNEFHVAERFFRSL